MPKVRFPPAYLLLPGSQLSSGNVHHLMHDSLSTYRHHLDAGHHDGVLLGNHTLHGHLCWGSEKRGSANTERKNAAAKMESQNLQQVTCITKNKIVTEIVRVSGTTLASIT